MKARFSWLLAATAFSLAATLASGCFLSRPPQVMTKETRSRVRTPTLVVLLPQQEIGVSIVQCPEKQIPGTTGLLIEGALLGQAQRCEEERMKIALSGTGPIRQGLAGRDVGATLSSALSRELASLRWLGPVSVELHQGAGCPSPGSVTDRLQGAHPTSLLIAQADYHLGPTGEKMVITAEVWLYTGEMKPRERANGSKTWDPVLGYHNVLSTSGRLGEAPQVLEGGLSDLARMLAFDLGEGAPGPDEEHKAKDAMKALVDVLALRDAWGRVLYAGGPSGESPAKVMGYIVHEGGGRTWVRLSSGELISSGESYQ